MILIILILGMAIGAAAHFAFYDFLRRHGLDLYHYVCGVLVSFLPFYFFILIDQDPLTAFAFAFISTGAGVVCARMWRKQRGDL
jgi:hypothetical protein